ncbi:MAG TPA: phosphoglycerate dehydrogenase [Pyrinomonadaceae bacterium]|nr:phosphoglycerate dehydrogenase [Pyrinomonadaceae bacterium]
MTNDNTPTGRVFVADEVSEEGLQPLTDAGFAVEKQTGLSAKDLIFQLANRDGLIVRSETKVTEEILDAAPSLRVIGRAGVGVDNIDVPAATARGIVVMNAPDGNTITTAEHTIALLVALARNVAQANSSVKAALWERKKFVGAELCAKTLGIVGLGRIGRAVAQRASALGMKVVAHDPFIAADLSQDLEIQIVGLDEVLARADFLTVHTPLTNETRGLINESAFAKMKTGARVINCARGGLIDEHALYDAITSGKIAGAALDVFEQEPPPPDHPLLSLEQVIVTPHLGASTAEAQQAVAVTVAEQMRDYLLTGALRGAVNMPAFGAKELAMLQPYLSLAESLGRFQAQLIDNPVREVRLEFAGELVEVDAAPVTRAFLAGLLRDISARVNVVNAFVIAEERGIAVTTAYVRGSNAASAIRTSVSSANGEQTASGSVFTTAEGYREGRITRIDGFRIEAIPRGNMIVMHNRDVPGVIGKVGSILGEAEINISAFHLGRRERGGEAMAIIEVDAPLDKPTLDRLLQLDSIIALRQIEL